MSAPGQAEPRDADPPLGGAALRGRRRRARALDGLDRLRPAAAPHRPALGRGLGRVRRRDGAALLLATAYAALRRAAWIQSTAAAAATMLVCDAWFDIVTAATRPRGRMAARIRVLHRAAAGGDLRVGGPKRRAGAGIPGRRRPVHAPARTPQMTIPPPLERRRARIRSMPASAHIRSTDVQRVAAPERPRCSGRGSGPCAPSRARPVRPPAAGRRGCRPATRAAPAPRGTPKSSDAIIPPGRTAAASVRSTAAGVVDVAQQIGVGQASTEPGSSGSRSASASTSSMRPSRPAASTRVACAGEHVGALVDPDHAARVAAGERDRDGARAGGDVGDDAPSAVGGGRHRLDHHVVPAPVLAEREQLRPAVVVGGDAGEQICGRGACAPRRRTRR